MRKKVRSEKSLEELAKLVQGKVKGDKKVRIYGVGSAEDAKEGQITFAVSDKFLNKASESQASAVLVPSGIKEFPKPVIQVKNPRLAFAKVLELFAPQAQRFSGVHPTAIIGRNVKIGKDVVTGPYVVIGNETKLNDNVYLSTGVYLGNRVIIGKDSFIHPRVSILDGTVIGKKVIIHSGAVIGSDGFGFIRKEDGSYHKIPQIGRVVIGDEVEIGANVTIDRATVGETRIGAGCKIDNLVHIAHNVTLGKNVIIVALVGVSGSSTLGDGVVLAGQAGVTEHVKIGDNVIVAAKSGVTKDIPPNSFVSGFPARPHSEQKRIKAIINHLPDLLKRIKRLEKLVNEE
ncbi:MAG: UDP-3-O-(3-hydroxymyristoyl)glucosamine N-acyltransferase [Candidatus Aerophobetes bacterium]|nr:UDP-3-O-(3-hydroxymyristoyl)glucosamine N-acyltransferase [Candidatus Aerophobetes bacterium]